MAETGKSKAAANVAAPEPTKPKSAAKTAKAQSAPKKAPAAKSKPASKPIAKAAPSKGRTEEIKAKVKDDMSSFKTKATDGARSAAEKGKDRASEAVSSIGKLIRESAATIDQNVGPQYGDYARTAAEKVEEFAGKMDAKDVDAIVADTRDFVRKSPAVAIGAAAAIGFVLARLFRSGRDEA